MHFHITIKCLSKFHNSSFSCQTSTDSQHIDTWLYFLKTRVLKLVSRDLHLSYYSLWNHTVMCIIISISHHLIWQGKSILFALISFFKPQNQPNEPPLTLTNWITSSMWFHYISRVWIVSLSIHPNNNLNTIFPFLKILCFDHTFTSLHTSFNTSIHHSITTYFKLSKQSKHISKFT